jgi:ABC-type transport system involved in multi-copper enzyme maturation permease subunit
MAAKELRDASWKFLLAALVVLALAPNLTPYEEHVKVAESNREAYTRIANGEVDPGAPPGAYGDPPPLEEPSPPPSAAETAMQEMFGFYAVGGGVILVPLAVLLGMALISGEAENRTILLLLSRPISRVHLLLTKYAVCAGVLLAAVVLGAILILGVAALRGYPLGEVSVPGMALTGVLMWIGSLFVLGVALLMSVVFRNALFSLGASALVLFLFFTFPGNVLALGDLLGRGVYYDEGVYEWIARLSPIYYWADAGLFSNGTLAWMDRTTLYGAAVPAPAKFLFWTVGAASALLGALWLFRRRAF